MKKNARFRFLKSAAAPKDFPPAELPEVAFAGRSNVGKSTLLNQLTGVKRLAFVSKTPGRTQLVNFFERPSELCLVDLPGYGFARAPRQVREKWESLITSYLFERETLCLVLLLVDMRREPLDSDRKVRDLLVSADVPHAVVATKADKLPYSRQRSQLAKLHRADLVVDELSQLGTRCLGMLDATIDVSSVEIDSEGTH